MYYYPKLSSTDFGIIRIGGPGLANCMFMAAQAWIASGKDESKFISPTWLKFSIGPYLRHERDKRNYANLFKSKGLTGFKKATVLLKIKLGGGKCLYFQGLNRYFTDINPHQPDVKAFFDSIINKHKIATVDEDELKDCVAVHVRLGDYVSQLRIPIAWYAGIIKNILKENPTQKVIIFSDGSDVELSELLYLPGVERRFYGNALADIWAISKCKLLIASDSTFSAWGAFLGRTPIIFNRRHFPPVFAGDVEEHVLGDGTNLPHSICNLIKSNNEC